MSETQYVIVRFGDQHYGICISEVNRIIRAEDPLPIPGVRGIIKGIINLRGHIVPVVDIRPLFGIARCGTTRDSRIIVVGIQGHDVGLIADAVSEVLTIDSETVEQSSSLALEFGTDYLTGIAKLEDRLVLLLDLRAALDLPTDTEPAVA